MRNIFQVIALAAASMAIPPAAADVYGDPLAAAKAADFYPKQRRGKGQNNRRGKGKCSPPKSRPNRLTISKRVRRKHRRAA